MRRGRFASGTVPPHCPDPHYSHACRLWTALNFRTLRARCEPAGNEGYLDQASRIRDYESAHLRGTHREGDKVRNGRVPNLGRCASVGAALTAHPLDRSSAAGRAGRSWYRSGCAEFDLRAVRGMVYSSDVELGAASASTDDGAIRAVGRQTACGMRARIAVLRFA